MSSLRVCIIVQFVIDVLMCFSPGPCSRTGRVQETGGHMMILCLDRAVRGHNRQEFLRQVPGCTLVDHWRRLMTIVSADNIKQTNLGSLNF